MINEIRQCVKTFFKKNEKKFKISYFSGVFVMLNGIVS